MLHRYSILAVLLLLAVSQAAAQRRSPAIVLAHVNVVDVRDGSVRRDYDVHVVADRITAVEPSGRRPLPAGARVVDGTRKFVVPGLTDMHVHWYDERYLGLFLANGVTSVRHMWGNPMVLDWRRRSEKGELSAPRLAIASPIVDGPNPVWAGSLVVADAADAKRVVEQVKRGGYDFLKVYSRLPREAYFAIAASARAAGLGISGHVPSAVSAIEASDAGQRTIEHQTGILLGASSAEAELRKQSLEILKGGEATTGLSPASRTTLRAYSERLLATFDETKAAAMYGRLAANGTWLCPTLTVIRAMSSLDDAGFTNDPRVKYMPRQVRESWKPANDPRNATKIEADYAMDRRIYRKHVEVVGKMQAAGVRILAGTDVLNPFVFPGFSLHDELGLLVEAGLTPAEALRAATLNPALSRGDEQTTGTVDAGKRADLVLLEGDPLQDIGNTRRIAAVITAGRLLERADLDALLAQAEKMAALRSIADTLLQIIDRDGVSAAVSEYRNMKARQADVFDFDEGELNELGYRLLRTKRIDAAVEILKLNTEVFPRSANVYDSLAEAYAAQGRPELAIANYKKALELDPANVNAAEQLKKLAGKRVP